METMMYGIETNHKEVPTILNGLKVLGVNIQIDILELGIDVQGFRTRLPEAVP